MHITHRGFELIKKWFEFATEERQALGTDIGLLVLRLGVGLMMAFSHGWGKLDKLMGEGPIKWADPLGLGPGVSLFLAGTTEFFASLLLVVGLLTRLSAVPLAFTMCVAVFIVHADDPFMKQEFGLLYLFAYLTLLLAGPGRFSLDALIRKKLS